MTNEQLLSHYRDDSKFPYLSEVVYTVEDVAQMLDAAREDERENIRVCTGCGWLSFDPISPPHIACCPDSNYIPLRQFVNLQFKKQNP